MRTIGQKWLGALVIASVCGVLSGCSVFPLHRGTRAMLVPHTPGSALSVETVNGSITVLQNERENVEIVAHFRAVSEERLDAARIVAERVNESTLAIRVEWPDGKRRSREGCDIEVAIPDANGLTLRSTNGKLFASGCGGSAQLNTSNGVIEIKNHMGPVVAETSNGRVNVSHIAGTVDLTTRNGPINVVQAVDSVKARTSNGAIQIGLAPGAAGPIEAKTSNGKITFDLGVAFAGGLALSTSNGAIHVDDKFQQQVVVREKRRVQLQFGDSMQQSSAKTSNGAIRVRCRTLELPDSGSVSGGSDMPAEAAH